MSNLIDTEESCPTDEAIQSIVKVTNHAKKRFKQRLGLPKSACQTHAQIAFDKGFKHTDAKGRARRYLDKTYFEYRTATQMRVYGEYLYLFCGHTLITVFILPKRLRGGFRH